MTLHIVADNEMDKTKEIEEFWINKIKDTVQAYIKTDEDRRILMENLRVQIETQRFYGL